MPLFVDTSAFFAILDKADVHHNKADRFWKQSIQTDENLITSSYVILETSALLQSRIGMDAVRVFNNDMLPIIRTIWIDESIHNAAVSANLASGKRKLSLVDCTSFEICQLYGLNGIFTFDKHFRDFGFATLP